MMKILLDGMIYLLTAAISAIAILVAYKMKPVSPENKGRYWLFGLIHMVAFHLLAALLPTYNEIMYLMVTVVSAVLSGAMVFFLLKRYAEHNSRLITALLVQSALMLVVYWVVQNTAAFILSIIL